MQIKSGDARNALVVTVFLVYAYWYESLVETQNLASHEQPIANLIHPKNINIKHANKS